jgi:hypothetical protein
MPGRREHDDGADDWGGEIRCFLRDQDGRLAELSQAVSS